MSRAFLTALLLLCAVGARAQSRSALNWVREPGAERCIAAPELGTRVQALTGRDLVAAPDAQVSVEGRIAKVRGGFVAMIAISDHAGVLLGQRELRGQADDCRALDERLAFVIAVALDPNSALLALPGELSDEQRPEAAALAELRAGSAPPAPAAERRRVRVAPTLRGQSSGHRPTELHALASLGAAAGTAAGAGVGIAVAAAAGVELEGWPLLVHGAWWIPQRRDTDDGAWLGLSSLELGLQLCAPLVRAERAFVGFALCAGGLASWLGVQPHGWRGQDRQAWAFGPQLALRSQARLVGLLSLVIAGTLAGQWPRARFGVNAGDGLAVVHRAPEPRASVAAGLELRL